MDLARPTNGTDIERMVEHLGGDPPRVINYAGVNAAHSLDDLFNGHSGVAILVFNSVQNNTPFGHWQCITRRNDRRLPAIDYFDPYGRQPDSGLTEGLIPPAVRRRFGIIHPKLYELLVAYPGEVTYSEFPLQAMEPDVQTCGRWVACRIAMREDTPEQFAETFQRAAYRQGTTPDVICAQITPFE